MSLENKCEHKFAYKIGTQENPHGEDIKLGNCIVCNSTIDISKYKEIEMTKKYKGEDRKVYWKGR